MGLRATTRFIAAGLILAVAGCGRQAPPPEPRPRPPVIVPPPSHPMSTDQYMKLSGSSALLVVRASDLAMQRSTRNSTTQIASRLKRDHTAIGAQLNMAGRRLNLLPSATLLPLHQTLYDGLTTASDFDAAYRRTVRAQIEYCVSTHTAYSRAGGSPTLRPVARFASSMCRDELALVRSR